MRARIQSAALTLFLCLLAGADPAAETPASSASSASSASPASPAGPAASGDLSAADKAQLHRIARESIAAALAKKSYPAPAVASTALKEPRGAFVTLKLHGVLRGCIGLIIAEHPLAETVARMARAAAFEDPRFASVTAGEYPTLDYEISALSPLRRIEDIQEIVVGKHGILLRRGMRQGLLLPQVAAEYGWDRLAFLENTCEKAGLPRDAWKDKDTEIRIFSAEVF